MTSIAFDRIATDRYDQTRGGEERGAELAAEFAPHLVAGTVLEVGVGTAIVASALARTGRSVVGVDLALPMLAAAQRRLGGRIVAGDALALPVAGGAVDNVLFCWVLHLVGDVRRALAEAARVLRPGGRVVAAHDHADVDPTDLDPAVALLAPLNAHRQDTAATLDAAAADAGLRPVASGSTAPKERGMSPAEMAGNIEERVWSWLWHCTAEQWAAHVVPALEYIRSLPDQDRPRVHAVRHRYRVYDRACDIRSQARDRACDIRSQARERTG